MTNSPHSPAKGRGPSRDRASGKGRAFLESLHAVGAGLWLGALVMAGATAGILFTSMPELDPGFGRFESYEGSMSNIGAGYLQNRVFLALDAVQFGGATLALASTLGLIVLCKLPISRPASVVRLLALGTAMMLVSYHLFVLAPRMQTNANAYWAAAELGDNENARAAHALFDADHPTARSVHAGLAISVLVLLASGAWSAAGAPGRAQPEQHKPTSPPREEPALAARGGVR